MNAPFRMERYLTDGGIETDLIFHGGFELPLFAAIDLMRNEEGRTGLEAYFRKYLEVAADKQVGFVLESPTWRASSDWAEPLGYTRDELAQYNRDAIAMMRKLREEYAERIPHILISGCIGPRGDGYDPGKVMSVDEARSYHTFQAAIFADEGVDMITAITMTNTPEARGLALAAHDAGLPCTISFTVETDGCLPTGMSLKDAIEAVDADGTAAPIQYMINCAHPSHFQPVLEEGSAWLERLGGLRTNASKLSHQELNDREDLDEGDPVELGDRHTELGRSVPNLRVVGGCCGTDERHIAQMADGWARS
ncbi:homocysteine S-methyltransferase family protein [Altererythrobacter sp.]|uniref:homocysteine S-methyltransferase family protein n=1 Tax=Altererythrobacter sp. TaxID=1872480 RepID=UPI003D09D384